jgi:hypothetical protein
MVTRTGTGIPGDALNVGLVGSKEDIARAMHAAKSDQIPPRVAYGNAELHLEFLCLGYRCVYHLIGVCKS